MSIIGTKCHKGTSTIMGTLIFVGIIFTAFIPMMLVMKQADTIYDMRKHELARFDEERDIENLYVYVHETVTNPLELTIEVENKGDLSAKVVSLWINDDFFDLNQLIPPMTGIKNLGSFNVIREIGMEYIVMVTTDRGKIFVFDIPITWTINGWETPIVSIEVLIEHLQGSGEFKINITGPECREAMTQKNELRCFTFTLPGTYTVKIFRGSQLLHTETKTLDFQNKPLWRVFA